jgi:hypothetical protein
MTNKILLFTLFIIAFIAPVKAVEVAHKHTGHQLFGSHGMVLFQDNNKNIYASHLPLYYTPHDYQIIYQIDSNQNTRLNEMLDKGMVTVLPENFDLSRLIESDKFTVKATYFDGHFERGGNASFKSNITFSKQIFSKKVIVAEEKSNTMFYLVPINKTQQLYIHRIDQRPSFDAIGFINTEKNSSILCNQIDSLNHEKLMTQMEKCNLPVPVYLETQDFK